MSETAIPYQRLLIIQGDRVRLLHVCSFVVLGISLAVPAQAGVMSDDLSRCLVNKSTEADRDAFMGWMFSAISADPRLNKLTTLDRAKRDELSFIAGSAMQRLLIVDCRKEAVATIKSEGFGAMEQSFSGLGRAATEQMFRSSEAQVELDALSKGLEDEELKELGREAGIPEKQLQSADE